MSIETLCFRDRVEEGEQLFGDLGSIARDAVELGRDHGKLGVRRCVIESVEEGGDIDLEEAGENVEVSGREAIGAGLVFLDLLIGDAKDASEGFEAHAALAAEFSKVFTDCDVQLVAIPAHETAFAARVAGSWS